ncbi:hypothetical protein D9M68_879020 [compost metagenome]
MALQRPHERHFQQLAEALAEVDVLLRAQPLVAEENHQVLVQRGADFLELIVRQRARQVQALDFGPQRAGDRAGFQMAIRGHACLLAY